MRIRPAQDSYIDILVPRGLRKEPVLSSSQLFCTVLLKNQVVAATAGAGRARIAGQGAAAVANAGAKDLRLPRAAFA